MTNNVQQAKPRRQSLAQMGYFRVDRSTWADLRRIARAEQLSVSDIVRRAIREFLSRRDAA